MSRKSEDQIVSKAEEARDETARTVAQVLSLSDRIAAQRRTAADLLSRSKAAAARNHFAEALAETMRRQA